MHWIGVCINKLVTIGECSKTTHAPKILDPAHRMASSSSWSHACHVLPETCPFSVIKLYFVQCSIQL